MRNVCIAAGTVLALAATPAMGQQKTLKIGFISTFTGPPATAITVPAATFDFLI